MRRQRINNRERFEESPNGGSNPLTSTSQAPFFGAFFTSSRKVFYMFNSVLNLMTGLINVVGTAYAILSILRISPKEIFSSITIKGMDERDNELLVQRKQARVGISLVLYAWIVQAVFSFVRINSWQMFVLALIIVLVILTVILLLLVFLNKKFDSKYSEYKKSKKSNSSQNSSHLDSHVWHEF